MNIKTVGDGKVHLIAGGGKIYTDIAARFVRSERSVVDIIASPYDAKIVENIINSGHSAALEFDNFVFGIEGFSRVTEAQLLRKRVASYLIKSGRIELGGKRSFDVVVPDCIKEHTVQFEGSIFTYERILQLTEKWYNSGIDKGLPEEDLRYLKPQATEFKAIIGMNAHGLRDWFKIRCCLNAQFEIRNLAMKMLQLCKQVAPDLFKGAGPSCKDLGYCPENKFQNKKCKDLYLTKEVALEILKGK